ncbi:YopJ family acetyltransferase [Xenorhabdus kozodoii]|uniref:Type III secretion system effector VopA, acetyltransferase n=1 Tax=Xenorhabdus kozodoii TaxID=351676 RepID=A0A2D0LF60_9GAMM|nr:YopJ family acetyltransferase [Xenorhabdus kozodoii]PHM74057.1 type III secretion system effector VopA, acetyltransferase [Xenorhabdus kozodoii]
MLDKESLNQYITKIQSNKENNIQFNNIQMDILNCKIILNHFNTRYLDMNAHDTILNVNQFFKLITDNSTLINNKHKRFIVNAGDGRTHFAAANVFKDAHNNISVIFVDSSLGHNQWIFSILHVLLNNVSNIKTLYIYNKIQNSDGDCLLFSLHFLKKMYKYRDHFESLHQDIFHNRIKFTREENEPFDPKIELPNEQLEQARVVYLNKAIKLLPIDFFKHAHSIKPINTYLENHPDETRKKVNKWQGGETLIDRYHRHKVTRMIKQQTYNNAIEEKQRTYSNSIEEKRLSLAQAALRWLGE